MATRWFTRRSADDDLAAVEEVLVDRVAETHRHVRARGLVDEDLVLQRLLGIDDGGQRVVVDEDELGRVLALVALLGDDGDDGLADEAHRAGRRAASA